MYRLNITQRLHWRKKIPRKPWSFEEFKYILNRDLQCLGNVVNQPNKSTQVIMRRPGD